MTSTSSPVIPGDAPVDLEAQIFFDVGVPPVLPPDGTETLTFAGLPAGVTTIPSPLSYTVFAGQAEITVPFQLEVGPGTVPGSYPILVENAPTGAGSWRVPAARPRDHHLAGHGERRRRDHLQPGVGVDQPVRPSDVLPVPRRSLFSGFPAGVTTVPSPVTYQPVCPRADARRTGPGPAERDGRVPDFRQPDDAAR